MKTIRKFFKTLEEAEAYQQELYSEYSFCRLIEFPRFSEEGTYVWKVSDGEA